MGSWNVSEQWRQDVIIADNGIVPNGGTSLTPKIWQDFKTIVSKSSTAGSVFDTNQAAFTTVSLVYSASGMYTGGVLDANGDVHFIPWKAAVGQKISRNGTVSTYSLIYTQGTLGAYSGGALAPNGDIYFVQANNTTPVGQKISGNGVVSTYSLVYTAGIFSGGVLGVDGQIYCIADNSSHGLKINPANNATSTYSVVNTATTSMYWGGVLAPNGEIHFCPRVGAIGQKISTGGVVSTYSLPYTVPNNGYIGGALDANGDIHLSPLAATVGMKISVSVTETTQTVSTYALAYTTALGYHSGVLAPNGDLHFIPYGAAVGQKISKAGVLSTYSLPITAGSEAYASGVLNDQDEIIFVPRAVSAITIMQLGSAEPFGIGSRTSSFWNKL